MTRLEGKSELRPLFRRLAERRGCEAQPVPMHVEHDAMRVALPLDAFDNSRERVCAAHAFLQAQLMRTHAKKAIRALLQVVGIAWP